MALSLMKNIGQLIDDVIDAIFRSVDAKRLDFILWLPLCKINLSEQRVDLWLNCVLFCTQTLRNTVVSFLDCPAAPFDR